LSQTGCESRDWIVAIDGGGSKVAGAIAQLANDRPSDQFASIFRHSVQGTGSAAPATWDQASKNISAAATELLNLANIGPHQVQHVVLMLAGAGRPDDVARVRQTLSSAPVFSALGFGALGFGAGGGLTVTSDMRPLLSYGTRLHPKLPTIVVIAGTGSFVAALDANNELIRAGGCGPVLGDEGSGWRIALNTLKLLCNWIDRGRPLVGNNDVSIEVLQESELPESELLELLDIVKRYAIEQRLMSEDSQLNSAILALASDRHVAARLAPAILDHAARLTDGLAHKLVRAEVSALVAQVAQVHQRIEASPQAWRLGLAGGLASNHPLFQDALNKELHRRKLSPEAIVVLDPLLAALHFATVTQSFSNPELQ